VAKFDQFLGEPGNDSLRAAVKQGRNGFGQGSDLRDAHAGTFHLCGQAFGGAWQFDGLRRNICRCVALVGHPLNAATHVPVSARKTRIGSEGPRGCPTGGKFEDGRAMTEDLCCFRDKPVAFLVLFLGIVSAKMAAFPSQRRPLCWP
jgi:hypothetical protein